MEYRISQSSIRFIRSSVYFKGESIHQIGNYPNSHYLIVSDQRGNVSQLNLSSGILMDSISVEPYLPIKSDVSMSLLLNN